MLPILLQMSVLPAKGVCPPFATCAINVPATSGGLCIWNTFVAITPHEHVETRRWPDASAYTIWMRDGRTLEMFQGGPDPHSAERTRNLISPSFVKNGVAVRRLQDRRGGFAGYSAGDIIYSGSALDGGTKDDQVLARVRLGAAATPSCRSASANRVP